MKPLTPAERDQLTRRIRARRVELAHQARHLRQCACGCGATIDAKPPRHNRRYVDYRHWYAASKGRAA